MSRGQVINSETDGRVRHGCARRGKHTPEYCAYLGAKNRCNNKGGKEYTFWGGRGIKFKFKSFADFLSEVGTRPSSKHSLDRINNDGHYAKGNLRWVLRNVQNKNKRKYCCLQRFSTKELIAELKRRQAWG